MSSSEYDLAAEAEQAWAEFRERLADRIAELDDDEVVTVELESGVDEDELEGTAPYLQLIGWGEDLVRAEVSSNHYLDGRYALAASDEERLGELGWLSPTHAPDEEADEGSANFHRDLERRDADRVAVMSVRALREVFGCRHPVFLVTDGLITEEDEAELWAEIEAEAAAAAAAEAEAEPDPDEPLAVFPESSEQLQELVDLALAPTSKEPLRHDEDGDIVVVQGRSVLFVRVSDNHPAVDLYCEMVHDIRDIERAALEVGILNGSHPSARFHLRDDMVVATYRLLAWPFAPTQLRVALAQMSANIDDLARDLAVRVGGHRVGDLHEGNESLTGLLELLHDGPARPRVVAALFDNDRHELIAQLVRLRTGVDEPEGHDLELVLSQLRAALRFVAEAEALPATRRALPPRPSRTQQLSLLSEDEATLEDSLWARDLEESS